MVQKEALDKLRQQFGKMPEAELVEAIKQLLMEEQLDAKQQSAAYCLIGDVVSIAPYLEDDEGYAYYKKALKCDENNYDAIIGICMIFDCFPHPFNTILTEYEYLSHIKKLTTDFERLNERQRFNFLQLTRAYSDCRVKMNAPTKKGYEE